MPGPGQRTGQGLGSHDPALAFAAAQPGDVGQPVPGRGVVQPLFGQVAGVGLGDRSGLDRGQRRGELLDPGHHLDQLVVGPGRPQHLGQAPHRRDRLGQHRGGCRAGDLGGDRHTTMESVGTDIPGDIHRGYPTFRDHPQKRVIPGSTRGEREEKPPPQGAPPATPYPQTNVRRYRNPKQTATTPLVFHNRNHKTPQRGVVHGPRVSRRSPERPPQPAEGRPVDREKPQPQGAPPATPYL